MDIFGSHAATALDSDNTWLRGVRAGHRVELFAADGWMSGQVQQIALDSLVIRIPIAEQLPAIRRHAVAGTATVSLEAGAARMPVSVHASGDLVRLRFAGPAEVMQRRQHVRVSVELPVSLRWVAADGDPDKAESHTLDLSVGGMQVAAVNTVWPSVGSLVLVSLQLPTGAVQGSAQVIGLTPGYDLRLAFTDPSPLSVPQVLALAR